jgi:glycosyltransferase involved in cell wall biosynthesis
MRFVPEGSRVVTRLLIVQPYIPSYRVPLFRGMRSALHGTGVEMAVAAGHPQGAALLREDSSLAAEVDFPLDVRQLRIGSRTLNVRSVSGVMQSFRPDLVMVEQAIKNLEVYPMLLRHMARRDSPVAMWGHGRSYSTRQTLLEASLKQWVTRRADWFFAYTDAGAQFVVDRGFSPARVTVLRNTIDSTSLIAELNSLNTRARKDFASEQRLTAGRTALFLGGVDEHKGIDFLLEAAVLVEKEVPGFVLLVGGTGALAARVQALQGRGGPVRFLGRVDGLRKALALASSEVMLIPEWVGLVAVDALASGCPIVTTDHSSHSPEFEYLSFGRNAVITEHDPGAYATQVIRILAADNERHALQANARVDSRSYTMEGMVDRFVEGICRWREAPRC